MELDELCTACGRAVVELFHGDRPEHYQTIWDCNVEDAANALRSHLEPLVQAKLDNDRLQHMCRLQREQIETLNGFADAVEVLRDIGKVVGCGHVDDPDGRRQLVNCVEQEFSRLRDKVHDLTAERLVAAIARKPEILTKLAERLQSNEIVD